MVLFGCCTEEQKELVKKAKETERAARDRLNDIQQKMKVR